MKFKLNDIDKKWKEYALAGCVCVLFFVCLTHLGSIWLVISKIFSVLKPVFIGFIIAYILNPLAVWLQHKLFKGIKKESLSWTLSVVLTIIIVLLIFALLISLLIPQIIENVSSLAENYQSYINSAIQFIVKLKRTFGDAAIFDNMIRFLSEGALIAKIGEIFKSNAQSIIQATTTIGGAAMNWGVGAIFAIYFLMAKDSIFKEFDRAFSLMLSPLKYTRLKMLTNKFNAIFSKYIVCELLDALIVGCANYIFMILLKMPDALIVSVTIGVTNLAPTFGPIVGAVIGSFILLLVQPASILPFLLFTLVLQTLDGYVIKPKLFGDALDVPGVLILAFIVVFGKLMGVPGMLIAIPVAGIVVYIYNEAFITWLELKRDLKQYQADQNKK